MGQLVRHHASDLVAVQHIKKASRCDDGCIFGVPAGREGIWLVHFDDTDFRLWEACAFCQSTHIFKIGRDLGIVAVILRRLGAIAAKNDLIGVPIAEDVQANGHNEGDHHTAYAANQITDCAEQRCHRRKQHKCLCMVQHGHAARSPIEQAKNMLNRKCRKGAAS